MPCGCAKRREKLKAIAQKVKAAITRKEPKPSEKYGDGLKAKYEESK